MAGTIYVDAGAAGANNGSSWANAYKYLQDALTTAGSSSEIRVAQGTYKPDANTLYPAGTKNRTATFQLKNGVALYGGFPAGGGSRDPNTYVTFLTGDINIPDNNSDNSYHVVTGSGTGSSAILDGFTITKGYAYTSPSNYYGAGMFNSSGSPTITNCTFTANSASNGGGMFNSNSSPAITNCTFSDNVASNGGGAMGVFGGSLTINNCVFRGNAAQYGGGICNDNCIHLTVTGCTFTGNSAGYCGGGLFFSGWSDNPHLLTNCLMIGNTASSYGGGLSNTNGSWIQINNCTFADNNVVGPDGVGGGASTAESWAWTQIFNSILWDNHAQAGGSQIAVGNPNGSPPSGEGPYADVSVFYSDVQGGKDGVWLEDETQTYTALWWMDGNIDADPCFVDADADDYLLKSAGWRWDAERSRWTDDDVTSRCIDAGDPGSPLRDELLAIPDDPDNEWGHNLRIDMGAFGGTAKASIPPYDWALLSDITNDGISDISDLDIFSSLWLNTGQLLYADFNRDGIINLFDFASLAQDWLKQTSWR